MAATAQASALAAAAAADGRGGLAWERHGKGGTEVEKGGHRTQLFCRENP